MVVVASAPGGAQTFEEFLDFEELEPRCVASNAVGDWGSGPVRIHGTSHRFGTNTNVAVVVDTAHPDVGDSDLSTGKFHNALVVSRLRPSKPSGPDAAWVAGSVQMIDDEDVPGAILSFDFSETGPVTFYGLTLLDHDDRPTTIRVYRAAETGGPLDSLEPATRLDLTWGRKPIFAVNTRRARLTLPSEEHTYYRLQVAPTLEPGKARVVELQELRARGKETRALVGRQPILASGISDVARVEVELGGSSAVDRVHFRRQGSYPSTTDEGLFSRIEDRIAATVQPQLELLRSEFFTAWQELVDDPTPTLRTDLDALLTDLDAKLLGFLAEDGTRSGGLLQCPDLPCGCPELRALQAWVEDRIERIREDLELAPEAEIMSTTAARSQVRIAARDAADFVYAAQAEGRTALVQQGGDSGCETGTFWEQFFCEGEVLFDGVSGAIASLMGPSVELQPDSVTVAGVAAACEAFRLTPKSADFNHVETGILPGQARRVPRGLYCVICRTADGHLEPLSTLDLVEDKNARPRAVGDEARRCTITG